MPIRPRSGRSRVVRHRKSSRASLVPAAAPQSSWLSTGAARRGRGAARYRASDARRRGGSDRTDPRQAPGDLKWRRAAQPGTQPLGSRRPRPSHPRGLRTDGNGRERPKPPWYPPRGPRRKRRLAESGHGPRRARRRLRRSPARQDRRARYRRSNRQNTGPAALPVSEAAWIMLKAVTPSGPTPHSSPSR
jgi:hypothetical protein